MRLFVSIDPGEDARREIVHICDELRRAGWRGNFSRPENLHLTIAFIGEQPDVRAAAAALSAVRCAPFALTFSDFGRFGDLLWVGVRESAPLRALAKEARAALRAQGIPFDPKPFRAHLTVAREVRAPSADAWDRLPAVRGTMQIGAVSLMASVREAGRLVYREMAVQKLGGEGAL